MIDIHGGDASRERPRIEGEKIRFAFRLPISHRLVEEEGVFLVSLSDANAASFRFLFFFLFFFTIVSRVHTIAPERG